MSTPRTSVRLEMSVEQEPGIYRQSIVEVSTGIADAGLSDIADLMEHALLGAGFVPRAVELLFHEVPQHPKE